MKFFRAMVTREQTVTVWFAVPDDAPLSDRESAAVEAAEDDLFWEDGMYFAETPQEVSREDAMRNAPEPELLGVEE